MKYYIKFALSMIILSFRNIRIYIYKYMIINSSFFFLSTFILII